MARSQLNHFSFLFILVLLSSCGGGGGSSTEGSGGLKTNSPPSFSIMVSGWSIPENQTEVLTAKATDPDGDTLTYSVGGEDASIFSVNGLGEVPGDAVVLYHKGKFYEYEISSTLK